MGIYDRDYYRQEQRRPASFSHAPKTVVGWLIAINAAVWIADLFTSSTVVASNEDVVRRWLSDFLAVHVDTLTHPLFWWQYLTAGFAHAPGFNHILCNMLVLFFLGRDVEEAYGPKEFLRVYLVTVVLANIAWNVVNKLAGTPVEVMVGGVPIRLVEYGASGALAGIVVLYALNFPHRTLLLFFVIPMPAWLAGALVVLYDIYGAMGGVAGSNVAYSVHLAGAAFALIYYKQQWNLTRLTEGRFHWLRRPAWLGGAPRLRVHRPTYDSHSDSNSQNEPEAKPDADLSREVDRILAKITREGEASLTAAERRTLETASREYQKRMSKR